MSMRSYREKRLLLKRTFVAGVVFGILAFIFYRSSHPPKNPIPSHGVWAHIVQVAPQYGIAPEFIYAIAWAESSLDAKARSSSARGMMQLTLPAWSEVTDENYRRAWDWRTNIRVAVQYMAFLSEFLKEREAFDYRLLAACYRYGPYYVADKKFKIDNLKKPTNKIYRRLFEGDFRPVPPLLKAVR